MKHYFELRNPLSLVRKMLLLLIGSALFTNASAQYDIRIVAPPGAEFTQTFAINNGGDIAGGANPGINNFAFTYDIKNDFYITLDNTMDILDINDAGRQVGSTDDGCAYRDKDGNILMVSPPSFVAGNPCQLRGVNAQGQMSGFMIDDTGTWRGFTHDTKKDTFEEFLPSFQTIAHAINAKGQVAGSVFLDADVVAPGAVAGRYGFVRDKKGNLATFSVNEGLAGFTRARGISESGLITGFYTDLNGFELKSFVTSLSGNSGHEEITLESDQIIFQKPCNPDTPAAPSADYQLFTSMTSSQVRNDGAVVGSCSDTYFNPLTGDVINYGYGWLATPSK